MSPLFGAYLAVAVVWSLVNVRRVLLLLAGKRFHPNVSFVVTKSDSKPKDRPHGSIRVHGRDRLDHLPPETANAAAGRAIAVFKVGLVAAGALTGAIWPVHLAWAVRRVLAPNNCTACGYGPGAHCWFCLRCGEQVLSGNEGAPGRPCHGLGQLELRCNDGRTPYARTSRPA